MRVKRLHIENFRSHANTTLLFGDAGFIVIRGANFAGKTSLGQALSMCLTPTTTGLDAQGRGFVSKIKRGATKAAITADVQTKQYLIQRQVTLNSGASGRTQRSICLNDPDWNPAPFDRKLEASRAALTVVLNTDAFLRMDEKEQKNLLAGLALPARYDFDPKIIDGVERVLGQRTINFDGEPFAVINQAYKKLFDERTVVNRQVKDFIIPDALPVPAGVDSRDLQEQVTRMRVMRRDQQLKRDTAVADAAKVEAERERIRTKKQALLPDDKLAYLRKVAAGKDELARLSKEKRQYESEIDGYLKELGRLEELPDAGSVCPTCDQVIDQEKLNALVGKISAALEKAKTAHFAVYNHMRSFGDVDEAVRLLEAHEEARREIVTTEEPDPVLFDFRPYDLSLAEIDAEIDRLTDQLRPVIAAEERKKEIAIRQEQHNRLKDKAGLLDILVKYFDKDGIKARLIGDYIGGFEQKLNEVMSVWGYSCALSVEPYAFDVTNARGDTNPVRELSGAERIMFSIAFQCAVSRTANIGIVVVDEVAMFIPELRPMLNRKLYDSVRDGLLEQVIMLVADTSWQIPALPGTAFFMIEDGAVYPLDGRKPVHEEGVQLSERSAG